ncbi:50S ribosomal protein L24e [Candidatus Woesearchaeota archaeon]|nr:50S ribosomal protein L24e [Candidatus Woesearchaeota archaeon]
MKCSFCKKDIKSGTGKMFVRNDGRIYWFDKKKCEKNLLKLKRRAVKLKWTREKKENK